LKIILLLVNSPLHFKLLGKAKRNKTLAIYKGGSRIGRVGTNTLIYLFLTPYRIIYTFYLLTHQTGSPSAKGIHLIIYDGPWLNSSVTGFANPDQYEPNVVHGSPKLPDGYQIVAVPADAVVEPLPAGEPSCSVIYSYNFVKLMIALGQAIYAITTLYRARGDQISEFGYVAFGLTVTPYLIMSVCNLLGSLACPEYSEIYLVESSILDEARARGGKLNSTVGRLVEGFDAKFRIAGYIPNFAPCQPVAILLENGALHANFDLPVNKTAVTEGKLVLSTTTKGINNEALQVADQSGVEIAQSDCGNHHFRLLEKQDDYINFEQIEEPMLFVPSCNVLGTSRVSVQDKDFMVESISWSELFSNFSVTFAGRSGNSMRGPINFFSTILVAGLPFAIIGGMTQFHPGNSTLAQGVWIMSWLCFGQGFPIVSILIYFPVFYLLSPLFSRKYVTSYQRKQIPSLITFIVVSTAAIGGFVVVGQMLISYGSCVLIP
jgi:hypothetical protein